MTPRQQQMALIARFDKLATTKSNRNVEKWAAEDLMNSFELDHIFAVMDYYVKVCRNPSFRHFVYNFETFDRARIEKANSDRTRAFNRKIMEERLARARSESNISSTQ